MSAETQTASNGGESFASLFEASVARADELREGDIVSGTVMAIAKDSVVVDIGYKSEGMISLSEFADPTGETSVSPGDRVDVLIESKETDDGLVLLSKEKADKLKVWDEISAACERDELIEGTITARVKGGLSVTIRGGVKAFLPGSQVDLRPVRNLDKLIGQTYEFKVIKFNKKRGNIVLSRRVLLERERDELKARTLQNLEEGMVVTGVIKNITEYGAFVDLGGIDGLLHVTDMAWRRVNHPTEILTIGQTVKVQVIRVNHETHRISLGMKQLMADPWEGIEAKYPVNARFTGRVNNITDYGAFVELEPGIEGLIHVSEMSWTKKNVHPGKIVSTSQEVEVVILEVDPVKRRISLGLKQTLENPWEQFLESHPVGSEVEGEVKNKTEFGLFIGLDGDIDGMVHLSDLDWNRPGEDVITEFNKGDMVRAVVLDVDVDKERISLGIKQLQGDPFTEAGEVRKGAIVTCEVTQVQDAGLDVKIVDTDLTAFIRRADLARDRSEQRPERFSVGQKVDARITQFDKKARKVGVSIKALEIAEEKEAVAQFGSTDAGASLGDILGAALKAREGGDDEK